MPFIADYDNEEEDRLPGSGGRRIGAQSGTVLAEPTKQTESGFVPWDRFVSANQDVSQREAGKLSGSVESQAEAVTSDLDKASKQQEKDIASNYVGGQQPAAPAFGNLANPSKQEQPEAFGIGRTPPPGVQALIDKQPQGGLNTQTAPAQVAAPKVSDLQTMNGAPIHRRPDGPALVSKRTIDPDKLQTDFTSGAPKTSGANLAGAKSLEDQFKTGGADAWENFLKESLRAGSGATALGTEGGVEGLLQQTTQAPNSAFDGALISGQGGKQFQDLFKQYGGGQLQDSILKGNQDAMQRWQDFMKDVDSSASARDKEINDATDESHRLADEQAKRKAEADAQQKALQDQIDYLKVHFPMSPQFDTQEGFVDWVEKSRNGPNGPNGQAGFSNVSAWADQIYGPRDPKNPFKNIDQFYADVRRMTPAEYEAFKYGVVPAWMGLGTAASGAKGGQFWGLGNTGNRVTGTTTNDPTAENADDWNSKQTALKTYYSILEAIAMAAAGA